MTAGSEEEFEWLGVCNGCRNGKLAAEKEYGPKLTETVFRTYSSLQPIRQMAIRTSAMT